MAQTRTLYNEYRPKVFSDVVGQDVPVTTMENALDNGNIATAYLFSGPRGVGKTTCARIFAKAILCTNDDPAKRGHDGCDECPSCKEFNAGMLGDFIELDAASNRGIAEIRQISERIYVAPTTSDHKVILIDEVHHLTSEAATALLKILEEPPSGVVFLLATTDPQKIPATIRSRCQWLKFRPIEQQQISDRLAYVLGRENIEVEPDVVQLVARKADGGLRDALSMLDMLITYSGGKRISYDEAETCFGTVSQELVEELAGYVMEQDLANCVGFTVRHNDADIAPNDLLVALLDAFSLAIITCHCGPDSAATLDGATKSMSAFAKKLANSMGAERLLLASDVIERSLWKFDSPALDKSHVFNEIILSVADPTLDPKHLRLDETDREMLSALVEKNTVISTATKKLAETQKELVGKMGEISTKIQRQRKEAQQGH